MEARKAYEADPHDVVALVGDSDDYAGRAEFPPLYLRLGPDGLILGDDRREYVVSDTDDISLEILSFWADRWPERYSF